MKHPKLHLGDHRNIHEILNARHNQRSWNFLGPRVPLVEPLISPPFRPSTRPATFFPEFIDKLQHCRQPLGTPQTIYFLKAHDVSYPNSEENSNKETNTMTNKKIETNKGRTEAPMTRCKIWGKIEAHLGTGRARLAAAHCTNPFWKNIFK